MATKESVARAFEAGGAGTSGQDVWAYGAQVCRDFDLSGVDLFNKWEVAFGMKAETNETGPTVRDMEKIQHDLGRKKKGQAPVTSVKKLAELGVLRTNKPLTTDDFFSELGLDATIKAQKSNNEDIPSAVVPMDFDTPAPKSPKTLREPLTPRILNMSDVKRGPEEGVPMDNDEDIAYVRRDDARRVELSVGSLPSSAADDEQRDSVLDFRTVGGDEESVRERRYMNETVLSRTESIRARIRSIGDGIVGRLKVEDNLPEPSSEAFFIPSPDPVLAVGRIRCELEESAGKINMSSVLLEGEEGGLVKLDLSRLVDRIFLIPGHIVAVHGVNSSGRCIKVYAIHDNAASPRPTLAEHSTPSLVKVMVASGPLTTSKNLLFRPLDDLLEHARIQQPDLLVLNGPFLDSSHPLLRDGSRLKNLTFEEVFRSRVVAKIESMLGSSATHVVLIPALNDVHHDFVCPQSPFPSDVSSKVHFAPNPAILSLGGDRVRIGATSLPVLEDISADTICRGQEDRFGSMTNLMLRQLSFYPIFPPSRNVPLDTTRWHSLDLPKTGPIDLMIVPSRLKPFVKEAGSLGETLCVNPGQLARGENGGTFAEVSLLSGATGPALGRSRTEVVRI